MLILDQATTVTITATQSVEKQVTVNTALVENIIIDLPPSDLTKSRIVVNWSTGYFDDQNNYVTYQNFTSELMGVDLLTAMNQPVDPSGTHYSDFKQTIYSLMQSKGFISSGKLV